jgi:hypothetical protein
MREIICAIYIYRAGIRVGNDYYMKSYMNEIQMALTRISQHNKLVCAFLYKLFAALS